MLPEPGVWQQLPLSSCWDSYRRHSKAGVLGALERTPTTCAQTERGPTSDLGWSTVCLVLGPLDAATSRGYKWQGCRAGGIQALSVGSSVISFSLSNFPLSPLSPIGQLEATRCLEKIVCRLPALASQSRNEGAGNGGWNTRNNCLKGFAVHYSIVFQKRLYQLTLPLAGHGNV